MRTLPLILILSLCEWATGQSTVPMLLATCTGGGNGPGNSSLYWSAGELSVSTLVGTPYQITQGFWQPEVAKITSTNTALQAEYVIVCQPNPVTDVLQISFNYLKPIGLALYSLEGRLLLQEKTIENGHSLPMNQLPASIYFLRFTTEDGLWIMTQKVIKQ